MSTGQRQQVKLAQAIAADPSLVLLDEPTDGLDPVQRDEMLALIRQISAEYGIDVLLSSHLLEEVERICDNIVALDAGRLVAQGPLASLVGDTTTITAELVEIVEHPGAVDAVERAAPRCGLDVRAISTSFASPQPTSRPASARSATPSPPSRRASGESSSTAPHSKICSRRHRHDRRGDLRPRVPHVRRRAGRRRESRPLGCVAHDPQHPRARAQGRHKVFPIIVAVVAFLPSIGFSPCPCSSAT